MDDFLNESSRNNWEALAPIRSDPLYEASLEVTNLSPVDVLAGEYLLSIMKAFVNSVDLETRWTTWQNEVQRFSDKDRRVFNAVFQFYRQREGDISEERYIENLSFEWPQTETDKIIKDLITFENCMKIVHITPGEDKDSGASSDRIAKRKFLDPIRKLLDRLNFHNFILLGDFGKQKPQQMLMRPIYRDYWNKLQNIPCSNSDCECPTFEAALNGKCADCRHVHKKFDSYADLGGLPVLLVIVMKGRLGDTFPASFSTLDMRVTKRSPNNVNISTLVQELGRLCFHTDNTPDHWNRVALVSKSLLDKFTQSVDGTGRISYKHMDLPVDFFVERLRGNVTLERLRNSLPTIRSMDHRNVSTWKNRFLLWAEPQNGKTGAFIWFLRLLLQHIQNKVFPDEVEFVVPNPDYELPLAVDYFPGWFFPLDATTLGRMKPYNKLLTGKYHKTVAFRRLQWEKRQNLDEFRDLVRKHEEPFSKEAWDLLERLESTDVNWDGFLDREGVSNISDFCRFVRFPKEPSKCISLEDTSNEQIAKLRYVIAPTQYHVKEFILPNTHIILEDSLKVSIPNAKDYLFQNNRLVKNHFDHHFILTPSYQTKDWWVDEIDIQGQSRSHFDPKKCRVDYSSMQIDGKKPIIQVLLVRPSQFEAYQEIWGNTHIIIKLPNELEYAMKPNLKLNMQCRKYTVERGGVGFARLVGQIWAYEMKLKYCFMFDDNVISCFELLKSNNELRHEMVSFSRVMDQMEAVFTKTESMLDNGEGG